MFLSLFKSQERGQPSLKFFPKPAQVLAGLKKNKKLAATPAFVCDQQHLEQKLIKVKKELASLKVPFKIAFSAKTNYQLADLSLFKKHQLDLEVVSELEYAFAIKKGFNPSQIIVNGPHKPTSWLKRAIKDNVQINIDNWTEINNLKALTKRKSKVKVGLRLNFNNQLGTTSRFGIPATNKSIAAAVAKISGWGRLIGLHFHLGTDVYQPKLYAEALVTIEQLLKDSILPGTISSINIGGGFPAHGLPPYGYNSSKALFKKSQLIPEFSDYVKTIADVTKRLYQLQPFTLIIEPGRLLVDDSVFFVTKVISTSTGHPRHQLNKNLSFNLKTSGSAEKQLITVDATSNMLPLIWYRPQIITAYNPNLQKLRRKLLPTTVYGASCQETDILHQGLLPKLKEGDLLIFFATGAYNSNLTPEFIFPKPPCLIV